MLLSARQWMYRSFLRNALLPLMLVEGLLVAAYFLTQTLMQQDSVTQTHLEAEHTLQQSAQREAQIIQQQLDHLEQTITLFQRQTKRVLNTPIDPTIHLSEEAKRYDTTDSGVFYTDRNQGGAAAFYSAQTPLNQQDHQMALHMAKLDPFMQDLYELNPWITALYFNTSDHYHRIYPWMDTLKQYPDQIDITQFNFYYQADRSHNPGRHPVWTKAYLDPAGQGWMVSVIAPIDLTPTGPMTGVVGIDISTETLVEHIEQLKVPWSGYAALMDQNGHLLAVPLQGRLDFGLSATPDLPSSTTLNQSSLSQASLNQSSQQQMPLQQDVLLTTHESNHHRHTEQDLSNAIQRSPTEGSLHITLNQQPFTIAWAKIPQTDWQLLTIAKDRHLYAATEQLYHHYQQLGYAIVTGLLLFYVGFLGYIWRHSHVLANKIAQPLNQLHDQLGLIGAGQYEQPPLQSPIIEVQQAGQAVQHMSRLLAHSASIAEQQRLRLQQVLETTTENIWHIDLVHERYQCSPGFAHRLGLTPEDLTHWEDLNPFIHPDDQSRLDHLRQQIRAGRIEQFICDYRLRDAHGQWFWVMTQGKTNQRDLRHHPVELIGTDVDITTLKRQQEALETAVSVAEEANQAKIDFMARMNHELKTPLNSIIGFSQLLSQELAGEHQHHIQEVLIAGQHLDALINDLLDRPQTQTNALKLQLTPIDLIALVKSVVSQMQVIAKAHHIECQLAPCPQIDALPVRADATRLRQVLHNLISNAIKYNWPGGHVLISLIPEDHWVRIEVKDNGTGIPRARQAELFTPFNRLGMEHSHIPGSGIGLSLCHELVLKMGGDIGLDSEEGQGAHFWFTLPLSSPTQASDAAIHWSTDTWLVISQDDNIIRQLQAAAQTLDYILLVCDRHEDGLELMESMSHQGTPPLLILETQLLPSPITEDWHQLITQTGCIRLDEGGNDPLLALLPRLHLPITTAQIEAFISDLSGAAYDCHSTSSDHQPYSRGG